MNLIYTWNQSNKIIFFLNHDNKFHILGKRNELDNVRKRHLPNPNQHDFDKMGLLNDVANSPSGSKVCKLGMKRKIEKLHLVY